MDFNEKINKLRTEIEKALIPVIDNDYVLLGLPYYDNVGDVLIWEGTENFLRTLSHKCLKRASIDTFDFGILDSNVIILLQGGGNFGNIWIEHQVFRLKIIEKYPQNKIVILPQTVFYTDDFILKKECAFLSDHSRLTICVRDKCSYDLLKMSTSNQILLIPDMAFYINLKYIHRFIGKVRDKALLLKRKDKEIVDWDFNEYIKGERLVEVRDWPSMEKKSLLLRLLYKLVSIQIKTNFPLGDIFAFYYYRNRVIAQGVKFVSQYKNIYTTRLHVAILSILLNKPFFFFDNSYGKNSSFFDTWLFDLDNVEFIARKICPRE